MAGRNRHNKDKRPSSSSSSTGTEKSFFSLMSIFKLPSMKKSRDDGLQHEPVHQRRVRPSDEDRMHYVGEPDIDRKATVFIAKFHEARVMDPERQTVKAA
ncbi:hypothetical protein MRB53_028919 [Persea americana]|uniref:Uncharacterized protein n=1 Tax=Persea americana TaxID=3435 RepID=A0ACC2KGW3_PERAE|nr:hypothetical protein MRB53_028919 [Persea americana]